MVGQQEGVLLQGGAQVVPEGVPAGAGLDGRQDGVVLQQREPRVRVHHEPRPDHVGARAHAAAGHHRGRSRRGGVRLPGGRQLVADELVRGQDGVVLPERAARLPWIRRRGPSVARAGPGPGRRGGRGRRRGPPNYHHAVLRLLSGEGQLGQRLVGGQEGVVLQARPPRLHDLFDRHDDNHHRHPHDHHEHLHGHQLVDHIHDQDPDLHDHAAPERLQRLRALRGALRHGHDDAGVPVRGGAARPGVDAGGEGVVLPQQGARLPRAAVQLLRLPRRVGGSVVEAAAVLVLRPRAARVHLHDHRPQARLQGRPVGLAEDVVRGQDELVLQH
mmetsp:Transcript_1493/g.4177  ORF Transcript_1493/g.4177 Transcript_1493/m.4177 type:complete len:330 (+) Transcript_1493:1369-2358(+)